MSWLGKKAADVVVSGQQLINGTITAAKFAAGAVVSHLGFTPANDALLSAIAKSGSSADLVGAIPKSKLPSGSVLQVASGSTSSSVTNSSSTWVSTGLSVTITPSSASSKILLLVNLPFQNGSNNYVYNEFRLMRNGGMVYYTKSGNSVSAYVVALHVFHFSYIDTPASTSALTFTLEFRTSASSGEYGGEIFNPGSTANVPQIIAMEIAG